MREAIAFCSFLLLSLTACSSLVYYPDRILYYPPEKLGLIFEEIPFQAKDGTQLYGWFFPAQRNSKKTESKGTIIQFHGNAQNMSSHYLSLVWLVKEGYNLFTFSYRGYGKSEGKPNQEGTYLDGLAALDKAWVLNEGSSAHKVFVVYGQSLGGAIAMRSLADFSHKSETSLIVLDSTFLSYRKIAQRSLARHWFTWILSPLAHVLVSDQYSAKEALLNNNVRLLVIHDKRDPVVPFISGQEIFDMAQSKKEIWTVDQGNHIGAFEPGKESLRNRFVQFLDQL